MAELKHYENCLIGIDPGVSGGIAYIFCDKDFNIKHITAMKFNEFSSIALFDLALEYSNNQFVYLEQVSGVSGESAMNAFTFGTNYGEWKGIIKSYGLKINYVLPLKWQSMVAGEHVGKPRNERKDIYKEIAKEICKDYKFRVTKAIADAVLIAYYGWTLNK